MGSSSDWDVMQHAVSMLKEFGIPFEAQVVSAAIVCRTKCFALKQRVLAVSAVLSLAPAVRTFAWHDRRENHCSIVLAYQCLPNICVVDDSAVDVQMPKGVPVNTFCYDW